MTWGGKDYLSDYKDAQIYSIENELEHLKKEYAELKCQYDLQSRLIEDLKRDALEHHTEEFDNGSWS